MIIEAADLDAYISKLPHDRHEPVKKRRDAVESNLPDRFEATINYGMPG